MAGAYEAAFEKFKDKYGVDYNIAGEYELARKLSSLDAFTIESTPEEKIQNSYKSMLGTAISYYLENKVRLEGGKKYDMTDFNIGEFINEFDNVMKGVLTDYAEKEGEKYEHKQYAGLSFNDVATAAWGRASGYNRPLADIWASQIRKGTLTLDRLQRITQNSTNMLDGMIKNGTNYTDVVKSDLANVVMAKNTLEAAKNQRSWISWLNPFNWGPYGRENAYLKELNAKIQTYSQNNFPVENALPEEYGKSILGKALQDLKEDVKTFERTYAQDLSIDKRAEEKLPINKNEEKEQVFKTEEAFIEASQTTVDNVKPVVQQVKEEKTNYTQRVNELLDDEEFSNNLLDEMTNVIEKMDSSLPKARAVRRSLLRVGAFAEIKKAAKNFCERFDDAETPEAKEELMKNTALNVVGIISNNLHSYNLSAKDRFVAAQKMADLMFNQCSPIAFEKDKYAKYGDRYVAKDDKLLNISIDAQHSSSDRTIIEDIRKELGVDKSFDGLTEEEKEHQERERRQAEENRIREEKEKSMRQRLENIDKETPDLTTLFGDTERDRQVALERIEKESPYWRSLQ